MATSHSNSRSLLLLVLTSGFFITGILFDYMPIIVDNQIKRNVELATNNEIQGLWSKPPIDIHSYYWLYNITNPEQFMKGDKIRVQKVGPFHFVSRAEKKIIELSANKYRIIYNTTRHMGFNESEHELSYEGWKNSFTTLNSNNGGSILTKIDDNLTVLNAAYATMVEASRELASKVDQQTNQMLIASSNRLAEKFNETLILNITARQALMGRKLVFVEKARRMIETFGIDQKLPNVLDNDIFGYVALMNETKFGPYEIYTGYQASMSSLGDLISYQGKRRFSEYRGKCNRLQASAGELRPMPIMDGQILEMSVPGFCRIIRLVPTGLKKLREGMAISYTHHTGDFKNSTYNPDNECFCVNGTVDNYCSLNGAIELAPCSYYSPVVLTTNVIEPDPRITNSIADFESELLLSDVDSVAKADNQAQLLILKRIGIPVKADITYTMFGKVIKDPKFRQTASVPDVSYVPLVMIREMGSIPPELGQIVVNLENFLTLTQHMKVIMYLSSIVLLCWLTGHYYNRSTHDRIVPSNGSWRHSTSALGQTNDSLAPSDRANSADSSRSQPPSRVISQAGSIDINEGGRSPSANSASTNQVTSDNLVSVQKQKKHVKSLNKKMLSNQQKALHQTSKNLGNSNGNGSGSSGGSGSGGENNGTIATATAVGTKMVNGETRGTISDGGNDSQKQESQNISRDQEFLKSKPPRASRFFSKVDEELDLERDKQKQQRQAKKNSATQPGGAINNQLKINLNEERNPNKPGNYNNNNDLNGFNQNEDNKLKDEPSSNSGERPVKEKQANKQIRKSWFMKVCSNFARILSGIRGTISEASQLDIRDNDYHDKQLEMLAGKIDNWYNSNTNTASTATPETTTPEKENSNAVVPGSGCENNNSVQDNVHDKNSNDSKGLKSSGSVLENQEKQQQDVELADNNSKNKSTKKSEDQTNKAQVNTESESSNKLLAASESSKVEKDKVTQVVDLDDKMIREEETQTETETMVDKTEIKVKEEKHETGENCMRKGEEKQFEKKEEQNEDKDDEKAKISQTGSMRRKRTIEKKPLASEKGSKEGYEPLNGDIPVPVPVPVPIPIPIPIPTQGELADNEIVANFKLNLINTNAQSDDEKTDDDTKLNSKLPPDQIDAPKVMPISSLEQSDLSNCAKLPHGVAAVVVPKCDTQVNLAQNSTINSTADEREDDLGEIDIGEDDVDDEEEEELDEEEESSNGLVTRNGTCVEMNHVNRADSMQSNQRVINKSDTSGDESVEAASLISVKLTKEDKAAAFKQMEMAMAIAQ